MGAGISSPDAKSFCMSATMAMHLKSFSGIYTGMKGRQI